MSASHQPTLHFDDQWWGALRDLRAPLAAGHLGDYQDAPIDEGGGFYMECPVAPGPEHFVHALERRADHVEFECSGGCEPEAIRARLLQVLAATFEEAPPEASERNSSAGHLLEVLTARELCALPDPPGSEDLLGPLLVRGTRLVLGGHTGEGKTTMALAIVRAVALGEPFLDWRGPGARVLVIDAEQGLRTIKRRLREAGLDESDRVDYLRAPDGLSLDRNEDEIAAVEAQLAAGGYALVLADPLYKLHTGDSNSEREAVDLMRRFDAWRERYRFTLALPVHCRKPPMGAKFSMHEFFGQSAYLRGAEVVVGLQRVRDGYSRLHFFKDRDGDLPIGAAWGLLFDREQGFRRDPDDEAPKQTAADLVRELLEAQPELTERRLIEETGYAERTVRKALRDLGADSKRAGAQGEKLWSLESGVAV